jgi:hypothetical protein
MAGGPLFAALLGWRSAQIFPQERATNCPNNVANIRRDNCGRKQRRTPATIEAHS